MKIFTKSEFIAIFIILAVLSVISFFNFRVSLRRGRDNERENDLSDISAQLDAYKGKFEVYPPNLSYLTNAPKDPSTPNGYSYLYISDGKFFQIYASLEGGVDESAYSAIVKTRNLKCGNFVCNFGKSSGNTPLDKTIEEYENELNAKKN